MAISNSFREAVSSGNVKGIRIMMKDSLLVDPTLKEFNEMSRFASSLSGLYDTHDGRELKANTSTWDDNYMDKLMVQVVSNFSKERLDHLKAVVKHLRPVPAQSQSRSTSTQPRSSAPRKMGDHSKPRTQQSQHNSHQEQERPDQSIGNKRGTKIVAGTVIGGTVGGTIASVVGGSVIIGVAVGAVLVGATVAITTNGE